MLLSCRVVERLSELVVREALPEDAARVDRVTQLSFAEYRRFPNPSSVLDEPMTSVSAAIDVGVLIAEHRGEAVGVVRFRIEGRRLFFARLAVLPAWRRRGVAKMLVDRLEAVAAEADLEWLAISARSQQPDNRPFWRALGFEITGYGDRYGVLNLVTYMERRVGGSPRDDH